MREKHPLAGKKVMVGSDEFVLEDYWQNVFGKSWMYSGGNFAAMNYMVRRDQAGLPIDDEVIYGKIGSFGHLIHVSELGKEVVTV